tara:strand:- start:227 stop:469 length:243 start_codon:yes stop_codon:yes gene_type:complete
MGIKIRGLYFSNAKVARESIARLSRMNISNEIKLRDALLIRQLATLHSKRTKDLKERKNYKDAAIIYTIFIDTLKSGMKH